MVLVENKIVNCFKYSNIKQIYKKINYGTSADGSTNLSGYLYIKLGDNSEYKILINTNLLINKEFKDVSSYLVNKNKDIVVNDTIIQMGNRKL